MKNRIILIKDHQVAMRVATQLKQQAIPFATVEAEYGDFCIEGTHATLAHHVSNYRDFPAPCIRTDVSPLDSGVILVSHLDLDTLGGIALLEDCYFAHSFWESEAIIDTKGALGLPLIPESDDMLMKIFWAWESAHKQPLPLTEQEIVDVTDQVKEKLLFLNQLLSNQVSEEVKTSYLNQFKTEIERYLENCVYEDRFMRLFVSESPMHFQMHKSETGWIDVCIHYNPSRKALTLSDISGRMDCGALMKELFGHKAGGQFRIGGTPRDEVFELPALFYLKQVIQERFF